ncbi:nitroreductase [Thermodesulfobacteriota bacterium]
MDLREAIGKRRSIRAFKPDPVPREILEELLRTSQWSPSSSNTQPWELAIIGGEAAEEMKARFIKKTEVDWDSDSFAMRDANPDTPQPQLTEPYIQRSEDVRDRIDHHQFPQGTEDIDTKRHDYLLKGAGFYGAPHAIIIYTERSLYPKALFDAGLVAQTLCLAALHYGLGTCLMTHLVLWPDYLREFLQLPDTKFIVLGIALGYPDLEARINTFERIRESLETVTRWYGF